MRISIILLFFPIFSFSQELNIMPLQGSVNGYGSELNFIQIDENTAYYTSSTLEGEQYQSAVFSTQFMNEQWQKGKYINLGNAYSTANIHFPKDESVFYFTACDKEEKCKIIAKDYEKQTTKTLNTHINLLHSTNTQPFFTQHNQQKVMYFVSDRKGGFGGMDIWLSMVDKQGNFGVPINAGKMINTSADEITPFYNKEEGVLYFSSNKKGGLGGFDIYTVKGKFNLWEKPINAVQFNSQKDEMYLTFYDKTKGYFSSNRNGALYNTDEFCCNDIFEFEFEQKEVVEENNLFIDYLPLKLYFHNDEPDCCTMSTTTKKTYKDAYISYFQMEEEYRKYNTNLHSFFEDSLKGNFNKLTIIFSSLLEDLKKGKKIQLEIKGYASPLHKKEYNENLSKRRIQSFVNYLRQFKNQVFTPYLSNGLLEIVELPLGEYNANTEVNDDPSNKLMSIYGLGAILERRIEIVDVKLVE